MPFDFTAVSAPFRMQPGLRRLASGARQLTPNRLGDRALAEKLSILRAHAPQALCCAEGFDPTHALRALVRHAANEHPEAWAGDGVLDGHALHLGWGVYDEEPIALRLARDTDHTTDHTTDHAAEHAAIGECLRALPGAWRLTALIALAFAEDVAILDGRTATIPWIAACLPSHWAPEEKVGRHFAEVHAPVADNHTLLVAGEHLARLVTGPERWERFVWTITRHAALSQHPSRTDRAPWPAEAGADALAARAYFRTEHQTFIPVPVHAQAVFTILIDVRPLALAITEPAQAAQLHAALASMSLTVLDYRGLTDARDRLLAWLAARSAT